MGLYQFHLYDGDDRRPTLEFFDGADDGAASHEAFRALARHLSCIGVEIWEDERLVARVERPRGASRHAHPAIHGAN